MDISVAFAYQHDLGLLSSTVRHWSKHSFHTYFANEDAPPYGNVWIISSLIAQNVSEGQRIGTSVVNQSLRHPIDTAIAAASLVQAYGHPFTLGIGAGAPRRWGSVGLSTFSLGQMREAVLIIRTLLTTGNVDFRGKYYTAKAKLAKDLVPREPIQIYLAGRGPKAIALAGEIADGVFAGYYPGSYADRVSEYLELGVAHRDSSLSKPRIMVWTPFFPGEQFQQLALAEAKKRYAITPKRVLEVLKDVTPAEAQLIPDTVIHGSTQECAEQLEPFRAIGADIAASVSPMVQQSSYFLQQLLTLRKLIK